jgi:hypothetical protein
MSEMRIVENGALNPQRSNEQQLAARRVSMSTPLVVIEEALASTDAARDRFPGYRLTRLIGDRLDLDEADIDCLSNIVGTDLLAAVSGVLRPFDHHLRLVIDRYRLGALVRDDGHAPYHHGIRPKGYDFHRDEVIPTGMEQWRADYREMPDARQMMAASLVWLYRAGKDNVWLRRVPCTWHAADAISRLKAVGALEDWARLYALYPGW